MPKRKSRGTPGLESPMKRFVHQYLRGRKPRRLHMTNRKNLTLGRFTNYEQPVEHKPKGLWYGIGDSWIQWCMSESSGWLGTHIYEVILDESKILKITNIAEFEAFEDAHHDQPPWKKEIRAIKDAEFEQRMKDAGIEYTSAGPQLDPFDHFFGGRGLRFHDYMNYGKVAEKYGGIEITPYLWEKRLNSMWYYGWDCASGCVWDRSAVTGIRLFARYDEGKDDFIKMSLQPDKPRV